MKRFFLAGLAGGALLGSLLFAMDEKELHVKMKKAGDHMGALRKSMQAKAMPEVAAQAKGIAAALEGTDAFWAARNKQDAVGWSKEGVEAAHALAQAAESGNADAVRTAMGKLGGSCKSCHDVHREKLPDGTYRIKQ